MYLSEKEKALQKEWLEKGRLYADAINDMLDFASKYGWENWKGKEPEDGRERLSKEVIELLKVANANSNVTAFRKLFPPAHAPLINYFEKYGRNIENLCLIDNNTIAFYVGAYYEEGRQAYILRENKIEKLSQDIVSFGISPSNKVYAFAYKNKVVSYQGWFGEKILSFNISDIDNLSITHLIPFNDGKKVLLISSEGIYLLSEEVNALIHPLPDIEDDEWTSDIDMEHAALSNNNKFIAIGDQSSEHRILDENGDEIAEISPVSSYPHFAIFSKDDKNVIFNSCHFYNGETINIELDQVEKSAKGSSTDEDEYLVIDDECRVYAGVATENYYILGDANGYIRGVTKDGVCLWKYFLGSTITGMAISKNNEVLWVGSCSGFLHKLLLGKGKSDDHVIGNGEHYEEFRISFWANEDCPLFW